MPKLNKMYLSGMVTFIVPAKPRIGDVWLECRRRKMLSGDTQWVLHAHVYDGSSFCWLRLYGEIYDLVFQIKEQYLQKRNLYKQLLMDRRGLLVVRYEQPVGGKLCQAFAFDKQIEHLPWNCRLIDGDSYGSGGDAA